MPEGPRQDPVGRLLQLSQFLVLFLLQPPLPLRQLYEPTQKNELCYAERYMLKDIFIVQRLNMSLSSGST